MTNETIDELDDYPYDNQQILSSRMYSNDKSSKPRDSQSEMNKCIRILNCLKTYNINPNTACNQKYTSFLLAVRLGNLDVIKTMLRTFNTSEESDGGEKIDLNYKGGLSRSTAMHIATNRTYFECLFLLDEWGGDIFSKNREYKNCF